ncbi:MAG: preprotein translocase subunit SecE [Bacteriovoracaceae bacterium]|nr:preprotein translocase subunit SecE [Bacteriovoracaceae bacterium]
MTTAGLEQNKKWVQAAVAVSAIIVGYILYLFLQQLGIWFELESKIPNFKYIVQGLSVVLAFTGFVIVLKNPKTSSFLYETAEELTKVIWPDKSETVKHTIGIIIAVTIAGFVFGLFDFLSSKLLGLLF